MSSPAGAAPAESGERFENDPSIEGFPLSLQQDRLWRLCAEANTPYRTHCALAIEGRLDRGRLREAWRMVVQRHEILRTCFRRLQGMEAPIQVISDLCESAWSSLDLTGLASQEQHRLVKQALRQEVESEFEWEEAPPCRLRLIELDREEFVLLIGLPAICADSASLTRLVQDLAEAYASCGGGRADWEEPIQYVDFSEWQNELLESPEEEAGRSYWTSQGLLSMPALSIPFERRSPRSKGRFEPESSTWEMDGLQARSLAQAAAGMDVPIESVALAAWALLIRRHAESTSIVVGRFSHGRTVEDLEATLGPLFKYLPAKISLDGSLPFDELARAVADTIASIERHHEHYSPEILPAADQDPSAGLPILFQLGRCPSPLAADGVTISMLDRHCCEQPFRLKLSLLLADSGVRFALEFDPACLSRPGAALLASQLRSLVEGIGENPSRRLDEFDLVDESQRRRLLQQWNATRRDFPEETVQIRFEAQAEATPQALAVAFREERLSFGELNARCNQAAHLMRRLGVGAEDRVALCLNRSIDQIVVLLGVLKAGAAYVPLDPWQPPARLAKIAAQISPKLLIAEKELFENADLPGPQMIDRREFLERASEASPANPEPIAGPENLAYVIYTSGSTGSPKGVMISQGSLANLSRALNRRIGGDLAACSRVSVNAPLAFDSSVKQILQILDGHAVCVLPEEVRRDGAELLAYLQAHDIDVLDCTPAQLQLMRSAGMKGARSPKLVLVGGEALDAAGWKACRSQADVAFYNVYGPTECTVDATACKVQPGLDRPLIGRPLDNVRTYVCDERLRPAAVGIAGELLIGGKGVGRGYFEAPALTASKFVPDPFADEPGLRLYRTGDRARFHPDGNLEFLGRIDRQLKLRGYRIEPGEIEAGLGSHPGVAQAVAITKEDVVGKPRIVAYVAPERRFSATIEGHPRLPLPNGMEIVHHQSAESEYLYGRFFSQTESWLNGFVLPEEACVLDVGANIGLFSLSVRSLSPSARILAFEPAPPLFDLLRINIELYAPGVEISPLAPADSSRLSRFSYQAAWSVLSGPSQGQDGLAQQWAKAWRHAWEETERTGDPSEESRTSADALQYEADQVQLSSVIEEKGLERIDLLRISLHRGEMDVLAGIDSVHWPRIRGIAVEICEPVGGAALQRFDRIREFLEARGYSLHSRAQTCPEGIEFILAEAVRPASVEDDAPNPSPPSRQLLQESPLVTASSLRRHAKEHLPEYMLPSQYVVLEKLPLNANGKVDLSSLPKPSEERPDLESGYEAPRNESEAQLAAIWRQLLSLERVGIRDNFFELGGDSILSIQAVARAGEQGMRLTPRQMFENQTIAELAVLAQSDVEILAEQGDVTGAVELGPAQRWLLDLDLQDLSHWNQAVMLAGDGTIDVEAVERSLEALCLHHDALRHRFVRAQDGAWQQVCQPPPGRPGFAWVDLAGLAPQEREEAMGRLCERAQRGLDLERGPLVNALGMEWEGEWRLLLVIHHLVVDGVSWRILLEDLQNAYARLSAGGEAELGRKTTSFQQWSQSMSLIARDPRLRDQAQYWLQGADGDSWRLPRETDSQGDGRNLESTARLAHLSLGPERTGQLVQSAPQAYGASIQEALLSALTGALLDWSGHKSGCIPIELEGHGREELSDEWGPEGADSVSAESGRVDLTRTVGWFTAIYPVRLEARADEPPGESLKRTKEKLRSLPGKGLGYGLLRHLGEAEDRSRLASLPQPEIGFNYLGHLDQVLQGEGPFRAATESAGPSRSPRGLRPHLLDFSADIAGGELSLRCIYSRSLHSRESIERLLELARRRLEALIDHCLSPQAGDYTPSDFPMAGLSGDQLEAIIDQVEFETEIDP